jgi:hypothetical protein
MPGIRGPEISEQVNNIIFHWAVKVYPAKKRGPLAVELSKQLETAGLVAPTLSTIKQKISRFRRRELRPEDSPWTLDTLNKHEISPSTLPTVFKIWLSKQEDPWHPSLTIREAKWVSRLSSMTDDLETIRIVAELCAEWEIIGELTEKPQLSSSSMTLHIYQLITGYEVDKEQERAILKRKELFGGFRTPQERIKSELKRLYGLGIIPENESKGGTP